MREGPGRCNNYFVDNIRENVSKKNAFLRIYFIEAQLIYNRLHELKMEIVIKF